MARHCLSVDHFHVSIVPLKLLAVLFRVHDKSVVLFASILADDHILHGPAMAAFIDRDTVALQLCEITCLLHLDDISNRCDVSLDIKLCYD